MSQPFFLKTSHSEFMDQTKLVYFYGRQLNGPFLVPFLLFRLTRPSRLIEFIPFSCNKKYNKENVRTYIAFQGQDLVPSVYDRCDYLEGVEHRKQVLGLLHERPKSLELHEYASNCSVPLILFPKTQIAQHAGHSLDDDFF